MTVLRRHAEEACADELATLADIPGPRPYGWSLTPSAVRTFIMGGELADGTVVEPKYIGDVRRVEVAIATLATDRALLLQGDPGTGKSWLSEHLAAAICGDSTLLVQGTAGTDESSFRYGWNYAKLLSEGPSREAMVESPILVAMRIGGIARVEELTRVSPEVQDALLGTLSEKSVPVPELGIEVQAQRGFNLIATANRRDRGVNELSSALRRRFAVVELPAPATIEREVQIVRTRLLALGKGLSLPGEVPPDQAIRRLVTVFRELRDGVTADGKLSLKQPSGTLSTAEAIGVLSQGWTRAAYYGGGEVSAEHLADGLLGVAVQDERDWTALREYVHAVLESRPDWEDWARALRERL